MVGEHKKCIPICGPVTARAKPIWRATSDTTSVPCAARTPTLLQRESRSNGTALSRTSNRGFKGASQVHRKQRKSPTKGCNRHRCASRMSPSVSRYVHENTTVVIYGASLVGCFCIRQTLNLLQSLLNTHVEEIMKMPKLNASDKIACGALLVSLVAFFFSWSACQSEQDLVVAQKKTALLIAVYEMEQEYNAAMNELRLLDLKAASQFQKIKDSHEGLQELEDIGKQLPLVTTGMKSVVQSSKVDAVEVEYWMRAVVHLQKLIRDLRDITGAREKILAFDAEAEEWIQTAQGMQGKLSEVQEKTQAQEDALEELMQKLERVLEDISPP